MSTFAIRKSLKSGFEEALARVPQALQQEGFGVLTEVDVQATLKQKLGADFRRYRILGACKPPFAHEALQADLEAGLMMPCNVVVYEDDRLQAVVMAIDPTATVAASGNPVLTALAEKVKLGLTSALSRLE